MSTPTIDCSSPSGVAVVNQIVDPQTIGDDHPRPGMADFHFTLDVSDQVFGKLRASATDVLSLPRKVGQDTDKGLVEVLVEVLVKGLVEGLVEGFFEGFFAGFFAGLSAFAVERLSKHTKKPQQTQEAQRK